MTDDWNPRDLPDLVVWYDPSHPSIENGKPRATKSYSRLRRWWRAQRRRLRR